jgi:transposase
MVSPHIDLRVDPTLDIHVVLDNLSAHKAESVVTWLANPKRARWHLHFTPTSSSWLNCVEGWFAQLTNRRPKKSAFNSVCHLEDEIGIWAEAWNDDPKPFIWKKPADEIIAKVRRGRASLNLVNSVTDQ